MIRQAIADFQDSVRAALLPEHPWVAGAVGRLISFFDISVLDGGGRYYWPTVLAAMVVLGVAFVLRPDWRARWGREGFLRFCFPRGYFSHPSSITDVKLNLANFMIMPMVNLAWRYSAAWFAVAVAGGMAVVLGPAPHALEWGFWSLLGFTLLLAVADDFGYWVWHYLAHKVPALWAFHKVHHSAEVMTPLVAGRVHPVEAMLLPAFRGAGSALVAGPALYFFVSEGRVLTVFGMSLVAALANALGNQLLHAHVPISWGWRLNHVFVSPATHQIHHSVEPRHWDRNMGGLLAVWDWMFGTLYVPDSRQQLTYGVAAGVPQPHDGLLMAWLRPFWDAVPDRLKRLPWRPGRRAVP